jgi:hypothetical protein
MDGWKAQSFGSEDVLHGYPSQRIKRNENGLEGAEPAGWRRELEA